MTNREAASTINALKCNLVMTKREYEALCMAEQALLEPTCNTENRPYESTKTQMWVNIPESENDAQTGDFEDEAKEHIKRLECQVGRLIEKEKAQDKRLHWCEKHIDQLERRCR